MPVTEAQLETKYKAGSGLVSAFRRIYILKTTFDLKELEKANFHFMLQREKTHSRKAFRHQQTHLQNIAKHQSAALFGVMANWKRTTGLQKQTFKIITMRPV